MIVDQVHAVAADRGRRHRHPASPEHPHRPAEPAPAAGLRGFWPTPHEGSPRTARLVLRADAAAPKAARDFTLATLAGWDRSALGDDVAVVVSELVTNAVRHGRRELPGSSGGPVQLVLLAHPRRLVVTVTDPGLRTPEPAAPEALDDGGRGLLVVGALADSWGWAPLASSGKAVWAAFDVAGS
ncbi:ATP-binding protein [Actinomadura macrotermitis]|uniref:Histidine kinase/HSP90-like ATPase domain-containing protein n=1 Tax=Actinomadura macrotermitis TaxID=2585200 RepID=A0A7K0C7P5_9ACTN|nr:ATP-binding protein [Actinomadura macrotermitis]MQY09455.1 hypothetical protein [Actinomadura macrotermitis]